MQRAIFCHITRRYIRLCILDMGKSLLSHFGLLFARSISVGKVYIYYTVYGVCCSCSLCFSRFKSLSFFFFFFFYFFFFKLPMTHAWYCAHACTAHITWVCYTCESKRKGITRRKGWYIFGYTYTLYDAIRVPSSIPSTWFYRCFFWSGLVIRCV